MKTDMNTQEIKADGYLAYQDESQTAGSSDKLELLSKLAEEQRDLEVKIAQEEERLGRLRDTLKEISERKLPELMDELKLEEFKTSSGLKIKISEKVRASIPAARMDEAIEWLDSHGHDKLVKRQFVILFNKDEEAWANKFQADLNKRKKPVNCTQKKDIHNRTLVSFVSGELKEGHELPLDLFGVFRQRVSSVDVPK